MLNQLILAAKKYYDVELTMDDMNSLMQISTIKNYRQGDILCEVGDTLTEAGFVLDGIIRSSFLTYEGKDITRFFHTKYSMVLDDCLLGFTESKYRCETITDSTVMLMQVDKLKLLIKNNMVFGKIYTKSLESGLRYKIYRENELMTKNATERYKQFVMDFPELAANVKQCFIATYLGIEPQSLSRIKKKLSED